MQREIHAEWQAVSGAITAFRRSALRGYCSGVPPGHFARAQYAQLYQRKSANARGLSGGALLGIPAPAGSSAADSGAAVRLPCGGRASAAALFAVFAENFRRAAETA